MCPKVTVARVRALLKDVEQEFLAKYCDRDGNIVDDSTHMKLRIFECACNDVLDRNSTPEWEED